MSRVDDRTAAWLGEERYALNTRLEAVRQRFPRVGAEALLTAVSAHLPPIVAATEDALPADQRTPLRLAIFDLLLLHAARDTLARPAIARLLDEILCRPAMLRLCARAPARLPAALSNAIERLGPSGPAWLAAIGDAAEHATDPEALLSAGAVLAWRLGEPRLRHGALRAAERLPPALLLHALAVPDWPLPAARLLWTALSRDGWLRPEQILDAPTLDALDAMPDDEQLRLGDRLALRRQDAPLEAWEEVGRVGEFVGFGGRFARPPVVVAAASPHLLFVAVDTDAYRLDADAYGAVATPLPLDEVPGLGDDAPSTTAAPEALGRTVDKLARAAAAAGATSMIAGAGVVAWTSRDSHRVRVMLPPRDLDGATR